MSLHLVPSLLVPVSLLSCHAAAINGFLRTLKGPLHVCSVSLTSGATLTL